MVGLSDGKLLHSSKISLIIAIISGFILKFELVRGRGFAAIFQSALHTRFRA